MSEFQLLLDAPGEPAAKIQIAQLGDYKHGGYGDFSITADDVKDWQRNLSHLPGKRALIDRDHRADKVRDTEAFGWIKQIDDPNEKGEVFATPEWTSLGRDAVQDQRYLFTSPSYGPFKKANGDVIDNVLTGVALTNKPFVDSMRTISLAAPERMLEAYDQLFAGRLLDVPQAERDQAVKDGNALPDGSYPIRDAHELHSAAVLAASGHGDVPAAKKLIRKRAKELGVSLSHLPGMGSDSQRSMATETTNADLLKLLDLPEDADAAKVLEAVTNLKTAPAAEPGDRKTLEQQADENGKVLLDKPALDALVANAQLGLGAHNKLLEMEFDTAFDKAVREGRATPSMRDTRKHFFTLDKDATLKELAEGPVIVNTQATPWDNTRLLHSDPDAVPVGVHPSAHTDHVKVMKTLEAENLPHSKYLEVYKRIAGIS